ncbi:hypothetical protein [Bacteroides gallinaceum]|uniref:hypothetical protein n=1 Tax=Bacteroides gallinaceum TaxID=1462571 RepID=UPI0019597C68|nr:hypothetical protein [Bacteroides gallinaceum]MBM6659079.1 hypothetical protein [Bacteroides gallinaceum]
MRKKYLSALLFGALLFASTGTFTSCKDYDDDINNLQQQITSNKDAIAALQKLVGEGKWVSSVTPIENGFTVTMNDGTTQNITGINGEDGKPGTVITLDPTTNNWVIDGVDTGVCAKGEKGEQGEQGEQGETGEQGPAGEAGEPGKSPYIDKETGNWFVWEWDEATSEYKAVDSGVYAGSTQIYVVEKEGFIELNVDGTAYLLPTTSDAYTVQAPASTVEINVETAEWNPSTTNKDYQALLKAFPEIGEIEKETLLKQGAELPVLVTPAAIDLTDGFTFSLQTLKDGMVEGITLSNPTKGISDEWKINKGEMTRAASEDDCLWTLQVEQELNENGKYADSKSATALVVENANGKVVKTPFAYTISNADLTRADVTISWGYDSPELADEIDLLAPAIMADGKKGSAPIILSNEFEGKYIIKLTDQLAVEKYGMSIVDGHKVVIANPGNAATIPVEVEVIALGLNGSTAKDKHTISVTQTIAATGELSEKNITLSTKKISDSNATIGQIVKWNIDELGFTTATQLDNFIYGNPQIIVTGEDKDGNEIEKTYDVQFVDANGVVISNKNEAYKDAKAFQIELPSADLIPGDYKVELVAHDRNSYNTIIYKTETDMTIANPKVEDLFGLATAYTTDGKVLQVVGTISGSTITYNLNDGVVKKILAANATLITFEDLDNTAWQESDGSQNWGKANWVNGQSTLTVNTQGFETAEGKEHLYKERNIRGTYTLFGNPQNEIEYDFKVEVMSPVYTSDGSNITIDATKMAGFFGKTIDVKNGITAKYAAGIDKGKALSLFTVAGGTKKVTDYTEYKNDGTYVQSADSKPIKIDNADLIYFGMSVADFTTVTNDDQYFIQVEKQEKVEIGGTASKSTLAGWADIVAAVDGVIYDYQNGSYVQIKKDADLTETEKNYKTIFNKYSSQMGYDKQKEVSINDSNASDEIKGVKFAFVNEDAKKYGSIDANTGVITTNATINESDLANGKAVVGVKMTVEDYWGMKMTKTFDVTITKE